MFYGCSVCISILIGLSVVACTDQKNHPNAHVASEAATRQKEYPASEKASNIQTSVIVGGQSNARFEPLFANTVHELTGKKIADGITTLGASNNPSETQFPDGSKILYVSSRLHQYIDSNGKVMAGSRLSRSSNINSWAICFPHITWDYFTAHFQVQNPNKYSYVEYPDFINSIGKPSKWVSAIH